MERIHIRFVEAHPRVKTWLKDRPAGTKERYGSALDWYSALVCATKKKGTDP